MSYKIKSGKVVSDAAIPDHIKKLHKVAAAKGISVEQAPAGWMIFLSGEKRVGPFDTEVEAWGCLT
jgi:hypothetical protein